MAETIFDMDKWEILPPEWLRLSLIWTSGRSYLQSGRDYLGYRGEVGVPQELGLLSEGQDPGWLHPSGDGGNLEERSGKRRKTDPNERSRGSQIRTGGNECETVSERKGESQS